MLLRDQIVYRQALWPVKAGFCLLALAVLLQHFKPWTFFGEGVPPLVGFIFLGPCLLVALLLLLGAMWFGTGYWIAEIAGDGVIAQYRMAAFLRIRTRTVLRADLRNSRVEERTTRIKGVPGVEYLITAVDQSGERAPLLMTTSEPEARRILRWLVEHAST